MGILANGWWRSLVKFVLDSPRTTMPTKKLWGYFWHYQTIPWNEYSLLLFGKTLDIYCSTLRILLLYLIDALSYDARASSYLWKLLRSSICSCLINNEWSACLKPWIASSNKALSRPSSTLWNTSKFELFANLLTNIEALNGRFSEIMWSMVANCT